MKYQVIRINEDLDFGCEEKSEDEDVMAVVLLRDQDGNDKWIRQEDRKLYEKNIDEGDLVYLDEKGEIQHLLTDDWTRTCRTSNIDIPGFTKRMEEIRAGKEVEWNCPFCGGNVGLMERVGGHAVIGCFSCDMRITLDQN